MAENQSFKSRVAGLLLSGGFLLAAALFAGRVMGFVRELALASTLGLSPEADKAVVLLTLPDFVVSLLLAGGISAALVPEINRAAPAAARRLFWQAFAIVALAFGLISFFVALCAPLWIALLLPGAEGGDAEISQLAVSAVAAGIFLTALAGVSRSYLNAAGRYLIAGLGTLIFNTVVTAVILFGLAGLQPIDALGVGILIGAAVRLLSQMVSLPAAITHTTDQAGGLSRGFYLGFVYSTLASTVGVCIPVIARSVASTFDSGLVAAFNYAFKLVELPAAIVIGAATTVAITELSRLQGAKDRSILQLRVNRDIRMAFLLCVIALLMGGLVLDSVAAILFQHGKMTAADTALIADLGRVALFGLPFGAVAGIGSAALFAAGHSRKVLLAGALGLIPMVVVVLLAGELRSARGLMGSVVVFQIVSGMAMLRLAGIPALGSTGWLNSELLKICAILGLLFVVIAGVDRYYALRDFGDLARLCWGLLGSGVAVLITVSIHDRSLPEQDTRKELAE